MEKMVFSGNLLWPDGTIRLGNLVIEGDKIRQLSDLAKPPDANDVQLIDIPEGCVAAPGFIDLQINGAFGHDFTSTPRQISAVARNLPRFGVTAFLPTLISSPLERYMTASQVIREMRHEPEMAAVLGLHIEGPYLNRAKAGSHPVPLLRQPDPEELLYFDPETTRILTLSPELPGSIPFIRAVRERGIQVGIGHSTATYDETLAAVEAGATWGIHLFNAMGPLHHRHPGIVGALLTEDRLRLGLIADNVHIHPAVMRLIAAAKRAEGVTLVSDSVSAAGMPQGDYQLGSQIVQASTVGVRLANGTLAGSIVMLDQAVRHMVQLANRPLAEVLQMASQTPAEVLGIHTTGRLAPYYDADIVILDQNLNVRLTMVRGKIVYQQTTP
jgi:N-acetylglucosamine-6-phosphate deacetylase